MQRSTCEFKRELSQFERLAAPTLERIRRDKARAPANVYLLLAYLETHLFDSDLNASRLRQACTARDNSVPLCFHRAVGMPPYTYIEDCRMEVACRLLRETDLKIWKIAHLLGYSALQVFSRAFQRWAGPRPTAFRARAANMPNVSFEILVKTANGTLEKSEADGLSRYLEMLYPASFRSPSRGGHQPQNLVAQEMEL